MEKYAGKSIFRKVAIGKIFFYEKNTAVVKRTKIDDPKAELERLSRPRKPEKHSCRVCTRRHCMRSATQEQRFSKCI